MAAAHGQLQVSPVCRVYIVFELRGTRDITVVLPDDVLQLRPCPATESATADPDPGLLAQCPPTFIPARIRYPEAFCEECFYVRCEALLILIADNGDPTRSAGRERFRDRSGHLC